MKKVILEKLPSGKTKITACGVRIDMNENDIPVFPLYVLEELEVGDLNPFPEIIVDFNPDSEDEDTYKCFNLFSELRLTIVNEDDGSHGISVVVCTPTDVEELDCHPEYQKKFAEILKRDYGNIEFWYDPNDRTNWNDEWEIKLEIQKVNAESGTNVQYEPIGDCGFNMFFTQNNFTEIFVVLAECLRKTDKCTRALLRLPAVPGQNQAQKLDPWNLGCFFERD